jgi:N-acyl homoserine lactone hydrolase
MTSNSELGMVEKLYILNGGLAVAPDRSIYTPGQFEGERITLSCNVYLFSRGGEWILWDTGIADDVAADLGGRIIAHGIRGIVARSVKDQLNDIDLAPSDIGRVILSHGHFDHVGNAALFASAKWSIQRLEYDAMFGPDAESYGYVPSLYECLASADIDLMDGDMDVFGDGSVTVLSSPGHTPGHCSLLVRLKSAGPVLLSADVAHYRYNLKHRCVPNMNSDKAASQASMDRIEAIARREGAQLWLNHDIVQTATLPHAPSSFT